jgi:phosphatidylserine/phosphatidylglycerophosphate/cardiolipin synthase-like enzyme
MEEMKKAVKIINDRACQRGGARNGDEFVKIRMLFGNIIGMPVDCTAVINALTDHIDLDYCRIQLWVGAWRQGVSWNHSKIIAVDGKYLHTGGHNLWDPHYLKNNPVHDLSMQAQGRCAHDGHLYLNKQWGFIKRMQSGFVGGIVNKLPDRMPTPLQTRVTVSEFPENGETPEFPPLYSKDCVPFDHEGWQGHVPMITMGRYGSLLLRARPSDDAFIAMVGASREIIRMALQDIGPCCFPGLKMALPGCTWPKRYLEALGKAILRGVDVEIALSNPGSIPGNLGPTEALYGNGWECADVASEIIKTIQDEVDDGDDTTNDHEGLRSIITENLRICYIRQGSANTWGDDKTMGMHAKHFIIDDVAYYIGSQNWYVCDLAEWGILVDDADQTRKVLQEYWNPMWQNSFRLGQDCDVDDVLDGLDVDRDGESMAFKGYDERQRLLREAAGNFGASRRGGA